MPTMVVPFIANTPDNMHCVNAVFRMVHKFYFGSDLSREEFEKCFNFRGANGGIVVFTDSTT